MKSKTSTKDKYNARIVFEVEQSIKDELHDIAKNKGKTSADVLRDLTEKFVKANNKKTP